MNVMRFVGRTSREAMKKLRDTLGPDALVLANRPCAEGVEVLAAAHDALGGLPAEAPVVPRTPQPRVAPEVAQSFAARTRQEHAALHPDSPGLSAAGPAADPDASRPAGSSGSREAPPSMSTVSFQDYVRQRLRERARAQSAPQAPEPAAAGSARLAASARAAVRAEAPAGAGVSQQARAHAQSRLPARSDPSSQPEPPVAFGASAASNAVNPSSASQAYASHASYADERVGGLAAHPPAGILDTFPPPAARVADIGLHAPTVSPEPLGFPAEPTPPSHRASQPAGADALMAELQSLRGVMARQFATLSWFEGVRRSPVQGRLLKTMVAAGFSLKLARSVVSRLPSDYGERDAQRWMEEVLARNLRCASPGEVFRAGNVCALIGPTGVGKTTTTAKLAARHVLAHGSASVALITVDTYRLGAHDQLRAFGRILGLPVHVAHDAPALHDLLRLRNDRQLVLIDTVGLGHRDERIRSLLMSLPRTDIRHVVVANASAQGETLDASLRAYEARQAAGVVLTKVDEAARLGGAIDCLVRQRTPLLGVCDGQRVPEDWHDAEPQRLVRQALLAPQAGAFALDDEELPLVFGVAAARQGEGMHA